LTGKIFNMIKTASVPIKGMHCRSCELLIEGELCSLEGVKKVAVSQKKGLAEIAYKGNLNYEAVNSTIEGAGYSIGLPEKKPLFTRDFNIYQEIIIFLIAVFLGYVLLDIFGIKIALPAISNHPSSLLVVLLIGLTAGFSTCMALIGGLVLGVSARFAEKHSLATPLEKFKPHLFFNLGRIGSYLFFGAIIGWFGSFFQLSGFGLGMLTVFVSMVMLLMGLQLTGLSPRLEDFKLTLPAGVGKILRINSKKEAEYSNKNSVFMGGLTFFLPCGFTQAMQLFAMTTGNPVSGALIMGTFALGTAPGLLGIGGLTSLVKGAFAQSFFRIAGVVVIVLSLFNLNNGLNLTGLNPGYFNFPGKTTVVAAADTEGVQLENGKQVIRMVQDAGGYNPKVFTVKKGVPVRWVIDSKDPNTCAASIVADKIGVQKLLHPGENVIEFTPSEEGVIRFTCSMGMFSGSIRVVNDVNGIQVQAATLPDDTAAVKTANSAGGASCGSGGCGCGGGGQKQVQNTNVTPVKAQENKDEQIIKTVYTQNTDISPNAFEVNAGKPVRMEIEVKDNGSGCMATIAVPGLADNPQFLKKGETIVLEFTPKTPGEYPITCAMGVPRGIIKVV